MDTNKLTNTIADIYTLCGDNIPALKYEKRILEEIFTCRTPEAGSHIEICPDNHGYLLTFNSCNRRSCPICSPIDELKWLMDKKTFKKPHTHMVFKLPHELHSIWLENKKQMNNILFKTVSATLKKESIQTGILRGSINTLHTWGKGLCIHPHIHSLTTLEGINADNNWEYKPVNTYELGKLFKHYLTRYIRNAHKKGEIKIPELFAIDTLFESIADEKWEPYSSGICNSGLHVLTYFSKSIRGLWTKDIHNITLNDNKTEVRITTKHQGKISTHTLTPRNFIFRILTHIPPKGQIMVRNTGLYSPYYLKTFNEDDFEIYEINTEEIEALQPRRCPICNKELIHNGRYNKSQTKNILEIHYNGKPPPKYGDIIFIKTENRNNAA